MKTHHRIFKPIILFHEYPYNVDQPKHHALQYIPFDHLKNQSMAVEQSQQINTSLNQHGGLSPLFPPPNPSHFQDNSYNSDDKLWSQEEEDEDSDHSSQSHIKFVRKRRGNLPKSVTVILKQWLVDHCRNPYPTEAEKSGLSDKTGLTLNQISNWFINARRRLLPQILETLYPQVTAANRDSPSPKRRKRKVTQDAFDGRRRRHMKKTTIKFE